MTQFISFHTYLDICDSKLNPEQNLLLDTINEEIAGEIPLTRALKNEKCPLSTIKFLLDHGADVNYRKRCIHQDLLPPVLYFTQRYVFRARPFRSVDEDIIEALIQKGADCKGEYQNKTYLCHAFRYRATKRIVKLFLDAGCLPDACTAHRGCVWHCLTDIPNPGLNEGVLDLLFNNEAKFRNWTCNINLVINEETPLTKALKRGKCSLSAVKFLLDHGADVNFRSQINHHPPPLLYFTSQVKPRYLNLCQQDKDDAKTRVLGKEDEDIIEELVHRGANCKGIFVDKPYLCHILRYGATKRIVKLFLDAGCSPNACFLHRGCALHCITDNPNLGLKEGVLELLLDNGAEFCYSIDGQSPICLILKANGGIEDVKLMMRKGISLGSCRKHNSPWFCATDCSENVSNKKRLNAKLVKLILAAGFPINVKSIEGSKFSPLMAALSCCHYETEAVELMIKEYGVHDTYGGGNLVNFAVSNSHCNLTILQLLVNSGLSVLQNCCREGIPLHTAILRHRNRDQVKIVKYLLEKGSPIEFEDRGGCTPLQLAVEYTGNPILVKLLLEAGASIDRKVIKYAFSRNSFDFDCFKVLLKYSFLRDDNFQVSRLVGRFLRREACDKPYHLEQNGIFEPNVESSKLIEFITECKNEVRKMDSGILNCKHTLRDFANQYCCHTMLSNDAYSESNDLNFKSLLKVMNKNSLPIFLDVISAKLDEGLLKIQLQNRLVYTMSRHGTKIWLNKDAVCLLIRYLSHPELLSMIVAYEC